MSLLTFLFCANTTTAQPVVPQAAIPLTTFNNAPVKSGHCIHCNDGSQGLRLHTLHDPLENYASAIASGEDTFTATCNVCFGDTRLSADCVQVTVAPPGLSWAEKTATDHVTAQRVRDILSREYPVEQLFERFAKKQEAQAA